MKEIDPLSFLKAVYMNADLPLSVRMRAAIELLPFTHPKLAVTAVVSEQDFATVLDRRLKRIEEMRVLENKAVNGSTTVRDGTIDPEPQPALPPCTSLSRVYSSRFRRI